MVRRLAILFYGLLAYALGMASFVYLGASLANLGVPNAIDAPRSGSLAGALLIDVLLIALFSVQHTGMARPGFKRIWTRIVPPSIERSTYLLFSALAMGLLLYFWRPLGGTVWNLEDPVARLLVLIAYGAGWGIVVGSTFALDHFDLFGLRQVYLAFRGRPYTPLAFRTPGPYRHLRHPIYLGWLMVFWVTPTMTASHLVLAALTTGYILIAIRFEERDLVQHFGAAYLDYRQRVPALIPRLSARNPSTGEGAAAPS